MRFDGFAARDFDPMDALPPNLVSATTPGNTQLVKGAAPAAVAILVEIDIETGS